MSAIARIFARSTRAVAFNSFKLTCASQAPSLSNLSHNFSVSISPFSTSTAAKYSAETDNSLLETLKEEISYEKEQSDADSSTDFIDSFTEKTGFVIQDTPGNHQVTMTKNDGSETITIKFSINDLSNLDPLRSQFDSFNQNGIQDDNVNFSEFDEAKYAEHMAASSKNKSAAATDNMQESESQLDEEEANFDVNFNLVIAKPNAPTLFFDLLAREGCIGVNQMNFFNNPKTALYNSSEAQFARDSSYIGPTYAHLSEDLKNNVDSFFEARGIDAGLTMFMQDYIEFKEQKEYLRWLEQFKAFIK
ncbi:hypothetical protein BB561_002281 [Smittium simulii]|uniref:Mitochondrial glyco protein n=1 Tax=Smittium simulii TaxID=133385 RepID=A0A2T9YQW7_9FUNG|nr:hypothetical protein BB561_002281 [Smittium simulii]